MRGKASSLALGMLLCAALLGTGIVAAMCAPASAAASPIEEFMATPTKGFNFPIEPQEIAAGPDGNLWYTDGGSYVYKMIASGASIGNTTPFPVGGEHIGASPEGIIADDGALWFTESVSGSIGCVTTSGTVEEFEVPSAKSHLVPDLDGITVGPDGNLWFTEAGLNKIGRLVPSPSEPCKKKEEITEYEVPGATLGETSGGNPGTAADSIASGPGGNLWFSEVGSERIGEMNTSGEMVNTFPPSPGTLGGSPLGIAQGSDGNMWFTEPEENRIGRITQSGQFTEFPLPATDAALSSIVKGPDGNMWFSFAGTEKTGVGCITPDGNAAQTLAPSGGISLGITVGRDGAIWFAESQAHEIGRLSPVVCDATAPPPLQPTVTSGPGQGPGQTATITWTGSGGPYECSIDEGPWQPCTSGQTFGPLAPGDHQFQVRETVGGVTGPPATYRWTVDLPKKCILRVARARVFVYTAHDKVRLVIHYTSYRPAKVSVDYTQSGSKGSLKLGSATTKFKKKGVFRLAERLDKAEMTKVRAAKSFAVRFRIPGTPGSCKRFYTKSLTIPQQISNQTVWFQSDSRFEP
jgi:streptogramin lyase